MLKQLVNCIYKNKTYKKTSFFEKEVLDFVENIIKIGEILCILKKWFSDKFEFNYFIRPWNNNNFDFYIFNRKKKKVREK